MLYMYTVVIVGLDQSQSHTLIIITVINVQVYQSLYF